MIAEIDSASQNLSRSEGPPNRRTKTPNHVLLFGEASPQTVEQSIAGFARIRESDPPEVYALLPAHSHVVDMVAGDVCWICGPSGVWPSEP